LFADFISLFLQKVGEVQHQDGTASICQEAYNLTLANHHTWVIRKAAGVAMYALPTKENLLIRVINETKFICMFPTEIFNLKRNLSDFILIVNLAILKKRVNIYQLDVKINWILYSVQKSGVEKIKLISNLEEMLLYCKISRENKCGSSGHLIFYLNYFCAFSKILINFLSQK